MSDWFPCTSSNKEKKMEDIEELKGVEAQVSRSSADVPEQVLTRRKFPPKRGKQESSPPQSDGEETSSYYDTKVRATSTFLPGKATIYVKTWGCSHNNSDGEYMAGLLAEQGYRIVMSDSEGHSANLWLLNSCTVKGPSEAAFLNFISNAEGLGKKVVVAGCVPQAAQRDPRWANYSSIGVQQLDRVVEVVEETLQGNTVQFFNDRKDPKFGRRKAGGTPLNMPKVRRNPLIEIIPLNTGCLNQCTYCKTKQARGDLASYPPEDICARIRQVLAEGVVEIWLTSEDTGAYGIDFGTNIVALLDQIVAILDELADPGVRLRLGMTNPPYILDHLQGIAKVLQHPNVYKFLHLPVQAASNKVLDDMRRQYTLEQFTHIVDYLQSEVPGITIATDIICGFPSEDDDDFSETLKLLQEYKFPVLHISQFYPRQGTPAAKMQQLPSQVKKTRSRAATKVFESYLPFDCYVGTERLVLVTEWSKDGEQYVGHDEAYRQVLVSKNDSYMGRLVKVKITKATKWSMVGTVLKVLTSGALPGKPQYVNRQGKLYQLGENDLPSNTTPKLQAKMVESATVGKDAKLAKPRPLYWEVGSILAINVALTALILYFHRGNSSFTFKIALLLLVWYSCFTRIENARRYHAVVSAAHKTQTMAEFRRLTES